MSDAVRPRLYHEDSGRWKPKTFAKLADPKTSLITYEELSAFNGENPDQPVLTAVKGIVFDVSQNVSFRPGHPYSVFAGRDPSRALAKSSLKIEDCVPELYDLDEQQRTVLDEWYTFFAHRYSVVGQIAGVVRPEDR